MCRLLNSKFKFSHSKRKLVDEPRLNYFHFFVPMGGNEGHFDNISGINFPRKSKNPKRLVINTNLTKQRGVLSPSGTYENVSP